MQKAPIGELLALKDFFAAVSSSIPYPNTIKGEHVPEWAYY
jgi:hypothetical protein